MSNSETNHTKYYFYDDTTLIIYFSSEYLDDPNLIYIGTSDNKRPKMAAAAFMQGGKIEEGFTLQEI